MGNPRYSATSASRHPPKTYVKVTSDTAPCWWGWCGLARQQAVPSHSSSRHCRSPFPLCSSPRSICSLTCYPFGQALAASPSLPLASTLLRFLKLSVRDSDLSITVHLVMTQLLRHRQTNLTLRTTGHVMHQQFNIQQLYVLPTLYLCVLYLSENKQRLVSLTA